MQGLSEESEKLNNNEEDIYSQQESDTRTAQEDLTTDAVAGTAVESSTETGIVCGERDSSERTTSSNRASTDEDVEESATTSKDALEGALTGVQDSSGSFTSTLQDMTDSAEMKNERRGEDTEIENLENDEITQISANASQHPTPAIDRFSACRTPQDGEVEVAAVEGGEVEVAAGEGGEGDDLDREGETEQSGMEDEEGEGEEDGERVLPITSSLVDVICMIKRLSSFVSTLYEMLCPVHECSDLCMVNGAESVAHLNAMETISKQNLMAAQELFQKMVQAFSSTLCIYADNLLSMDVCATPRVIALKLLGRQLLQHLRWDRKNNHLWGCRHMAAGINTCYQYVSRESQYLCDSFEPVTEEMCSRINNVADLITLIPMFHSMLSQAIPMFEDINQTRSEDFVSDLEDFVVVGDVPHIPTSMTDDDEEETSSAESTTSTSYHSNSSTTRRRSQQTSREARASTSRQSSSELGNVRAYRDRESLVDLVLGHCEWHLNCVKDSLINLLAEKINLFFKQGLSLLVELDMEGFTIEKRLKPLTEFLTNHLEALSQWLYPDCYDRVHLVLWYFIAEDFEQEAYKLKKFHNKAEEKAMLLLQALSYMIEFIHDGGQGLPIDQLIPPAEHVMQLLQLFSWSTKKLINLYHHLVAEKSGDGQTSENSLQVPPRELLQRMRYDLHNIRKCFTGKQLVDWILKNYTIQVPSTEADTSIDICSDIDGAMQLAQRLLDLNVICPTVDELSSISNRLQNPRAESASPLNSPYPEISIHSEPNTMGRHRWTSSESETSTLKRERTSTFGTEDTRSEEKFTEGTEEQRGSGTEEGSVGDLPRISVDTATEKSVEHLNVMPQEGAVAQTPIDAVAIGKENAEGKTENTIGVLRSRPSSVDTSAVAEDEKNDSQLTTTRVESAERRREDFAGSRPSHEERNKKDKLSADGSETMESSAVRDQSARSSDVRDFHHGIQSPQSTGSRSMTPASSHSTTSDSTSRHSVETHLFMNSTVHLYRFCDVDDEELYSYHSDATIYSARDFPGNTGGNNECHRIKVGMQNKSIDPLYVVTVIFTRKRKDSKAKRLLKHVPKPMLEYLKGESWNFGCF
ncbi:uncharacterized protein [Ptychodera flava]|uniref:uncharacterized protein n=1 Tax=Ptychodera flava TaxID=63121 RepID=UPI00396AA3C1